MLFRQVKEKSITHVEGEAILILSFIANLSGRGRGEEEAVNRSKHFPLILITFDSNWFTLVIVHNYSFSSNRR